jgi:hypothetical protein
VAEAGWYNDEHDPARARWFDGTSWTEHTIIKAEWVGLGKPPAPDGPPLRPYRPIPDPPRASVPRVVWILLAAAVLAVVVVLLVTR